MMKDLFDEFGRCLPGNDVGPAHSKTRRYFQCTQPEINLQSIYKRALSILGPADDISFDEFQQRINTALDSLNKGDTINMTKGAFIPFLLPVNSGLDDLGTAMHQHYLPALKSAFHEELPESEFTIEVPNLSERLSLREGTNHCELMDRIRKESIAGIVFPCMTEYSIPAALQQINLLPEQCITSGAVDITAALIAAPTLLLRNEGYPPTLWLTAIQGESENIGYHYEAYGYNLKLYRRAHLGQASEYWWQSVTVLA